MRVNQRGRAPDILDVLHVLVHVRAEIEVVRCELAQIGSLLMSKISQAEQNLIDALALATDEVAAALEAKMAELGAALAAANADDPELMAAVQAQIDRLKGMGRNPANPFPPAPVVPPTP